MLTMKNIIREGNQTLRLKALPVQTPVSKEDQKILIDMLAYLINSQNEETAQKYGLRPGVGLAAPQINVSKRMLVILANDFEGKLHILPLVNPVIINHSKEKIFLPDGEGCLSVNRPTEGLTPRYQSITVKALFFNVKTGAFEDKQFAFTDYIAIVFQHEYDHLEGILYVDKLFKELPDAKPLIAKVAKTK